jgi:ABC-type proline/glycine betaine transport system ATPase subunit
VQAALAEALAGRTAIVIAHRLSTIRAANEIAVVEGGRIVERGTHDALLAARGRYAALYRTQFAQSTATAEVADVACLVPGCDHADSRADVVHLPVPESGQPSDVVVSNAHDRRTRRAR